jgi:hypothetical protein
MNGLTLVFLKISVLKARHAAPIAIGYLHCSLRGQRMRPRQFIAGLGGAAAGALSVFLGHFGRHDLSHASVGGRCRSCLRRNRRRTHRSKHQRRLHEGAGSQSATWQRRAVRRDQKSDRRQGAGCDQRNWGGRAQDLARSHQGAGERRTRRMASHWTSSSSARVASTRAPPWGEVRPRSRRNQEADCAAVHVKVDFTSRKRFRKQALLAASRNELYPSIDQPFVQ